MPHSTEAVPSADRRRMTAWTVAVALLTTVLAIDIGWHVLASRAARPAGDHTDSHDDGDPHGEGQSEPESHHDTDETSVSLSQNALDNIGFRPVTVELGKFERTISIPAMVVEQPGQSRIHVTAPLTGVVTEIYVAQGEAIQPNSKVCDIRLTHEDMVTAQRDFLRTAESLDVVNLEIARLESLGEGVIAGRRVLEQQYERQKLEATLRAAKQALLLHGLEEAQVQEILDSRQLLQSLTIRAPAHTHSGEEGGEDHCFHVQSLPVSVGQHVEAGHELAVLADHWELLIEGSAFEQEVGHLRDAARHGWPLTARLLDTRSPEGEITGLKLLYLADHIDPESRAFRFYVRLPNQVELDQQTGGRRYMEWRIKPGQRMELTVPVEQWDNRIVLPIDAIVQEGAETYVYRQRGDRFDRVSVRVEYRGRESVVVAPGGELVPGDVVAGSGTYQIHLALKNKSNGAVAEHDDHDH